MSINKLNFTDERLRKLSPDKSGKRLYFYDTTQPSLVLQLTTKGFKTFQMQAWSKKLGRSVVKTIGAYPKFSIAEARSHTLKLLNLLNDGVDIIAEAMTFREEATFQEAFDAWLAVAKQHKKSWPGDISTFNLYIKSPFGDKKMSWFTRTKIEAWHISLTNQAKQRGDAKISSTTANRALTLLSTIFNSNQVKLTSNPCDGVKKFKETPRDRFLSPEEMQRFFIALEDPDTPEDLHDFVLLSLFTGARRANVMAMQWKDLDLDQLTWLIPASESKNGEGILLPLTEPALEILQRRIETTNSNFVFAGDGVTGHLVEPKTAWNTLKKRSGINNLRLHDLRRTLGSYQAIGGASLPIIGKSLGHKTAQATQIYARLNLDPVRGAMSKAASLMLATKNLPSKMAGNSNTKD